MKLLLSVAFWIGWLMLGLSLTLSVYMTPSVNEPSDFGRVHRKELMRIFLVALGLLLVGLLCIFASMFFQPDLVSGFFFSKN